MMDFVCVCVYVCVCVCVFVMCAQSINAESTRLLEACFHGDVVQLHGWSSLMFSLSYDDGAVR